MWHHEIEVEIRRTLNDGIPFTKEIDVARVEIVLPEVCGEPCSAVGVHTPEGAIDRASNAP